jgi:hypothetical protein
MRAQVPFRVRMVAYINGKLEGDRVEFTWPVTCNRKTYTLYVLKLDVLDARTSGMSLDAALKPYNPKFQVVGEATAVQRFESTPPRQQVIIDGNLRVNGGARMLSIDTITGPPAAATPAP